MNADEPPLGPWYYKWVRGGQVIVASALTVTSSLNAVTQFRSGHIGMGWLFVGFALLAFGYAVFNLVRWLEMRTAAG